MADGSVVRYSPPMAAMNTPTKTFAPGKREKAAGGDCKVGGFAA
jgi:hypothetical protein